MPARPFFSSVRRCSIFSALTAALLVVSAALPAHAARRYAAVSSFEHAEQMRDALESRPESSRTRGDYERVLDAYRDVYHGNPGDPRAAQAVNMVAGLLAEEGRIFHQDKTSLDAIGQFEFLRTQYPTSSYRASALLSEATIYLHDLHQPAAARTAYQTFLRSYPQHPLAAQARAGLKEIQHQRSQQSATTSRDEIAESTLSERNVPPETMTGSSALPARERGGRAPNSARNAATYSERGAPQPATTNTPHGNELTRLEQEEPSAARVTAPAPLPPATPQAAEAAAGHPVLTGAVRTAAQEHHGRLPLVTNVRHWSTPVYTRVAIDLQDQVQYEAARVPNPDRIYFDLHGARVAPELIGKNVNVTDDGFLQRIRVAQFSNDVTRIVLDVSQVSEYSAFFLPNPWRLIIDIHGKGRASAPPQQIASATPASRAPQSAIRPSEPFAASGETGTQATNALHDIAALGAQPDQVRATSRPTTRPIAASVKRPTQAQNDLAADAAADSATSDTARATIPALPKSKTTHRETHTDDVTVDDEDGTGPRNTSREASSIDGQRSLTRALGLKIGRIVVDAGHGGHDSGTLGPGGIQEKDVVLDVALRLGKLLRQRLGADVIYTRDDDTFIPLEQRTAIANKAQADLFISVHANSSSDPTARGVETYYLNFTTSPDALEVAARENAVSDQSIHELSGLVKKITLKDKIDESREFASDVETSLYSGLERGNSGLRDRGVKKAPFVVLIGANMPSILAEISFLTNPDDASQLRDPQYRERIAESLYRGVAKYVSGLSGLRIAQNNSHAPGN